MKYRYIYRYITPYIQSKPNIIDSKYAKRAPSQYTPALPPQKPGQEEDLRFFASFILAPQIVRHAFSEFRARFFTTEMLIVSKMKDRRDQNTVKGRGRPRAQNTGYHGPGIV